MSISHITFLDIETVPLNQYYSYGDGVNFFRKRFEKEMYELPITPSIGLSYDTCNDFYHQKAGLYAEFGKIVAISIGKFVDKDDKFYIRTITDRNEVTLLNQAVDSIKKAGGSTLCAHNGNEFDFPYLMRRLIINNIPIPAILATFNKKPWELAFEDTMKMWGGSQWNYKVSLDLLANVLGLPSPKQNISGADVSKIYYDSFNVEKDDLPFEKETACLKTIGDYCAGDVLTLANVYSRMKGLPIIEDSKVEYL